MTAEFRDIENTYDRIYNRESSIFENNLRNLIQVKKLPKPSKQANDLISKVDRVIFGQRENGDVTVLELYKKIYCAALTVIEFCQIQEIPIYCDNEATLPADEPKQTNLFRARQSKFARLLFKPELQNDCALRNLTERQVQEHWSELYNDSSYDGNSSTFLHSEQNRIETMQESLKQVDALTISDLKRVLKEKKSWSRPGFDGVPTGWFKLFKHSHPILLKVIQNLIANPASMPEFMTVGVTRLFAKSTKPEDIVNPDKYRPVSSPPVLYKIITKCIGDKIFQYLMKNEIMTEQQMGGVKGGYAQFKPVTIDLAIMSLENLCGLYVDFRKAFDLVPHAYVVDLLRTYKVDESYVNFLKFAMEKWFNRIEFGVDRYIQVQLHRGLFQGDSISPLLFWICLNPLSVAIKQLNLGLKLANDFTFSHILFMDDLKLFAHDFDTLKIMFAKADEFAADVKFEINYGKCKVFQIRDKRNVEVVNFRLSGKNISPVREGDGYLGYATHLKFEPCDQENDLIEGLKEKISKIRSSQLSLEDKIILLNNCGLARVIKTFGTLKWCDTHYDKLRNCIKEAFSNYNYHLLTLHQNRGGMGLIDIDNKYVRMRMILKRLQYPAEIKELIGKMDTERKSIWPNDKVVNFLTTSFEIESTEISWILSRNIALSQEMVRLTIQSSGTYVEQVQRINSNISEIISEELHGLEIADENHQEIIEKLNLLKLYGMLPKTTYLELRKSFPQIPFECILRISEAVMSSNLNFQSPPLS